MKKSMLQKRVWCDLPDALLERMLPLLPLPSLLRFRCVCKSWNSYILSTDFLHLCASSAANHVTAAHDHSCSSSYLLLSTWSSDYPLLAFNPSRQTWHLPSLDFLLKGTDQLQAMEGVSLSLVAAAGGLLCLSDGERKMIVCNPITKAKREIECKIEGEGEDEGLLKNLAMASMRYDEEKKGFQLVMVGTCEGDGGRQATYVYESRQHMWKTCRKQRESFFFESSGVFVGSKDFFILNSFPIKLLAFNTATGTWRDHPAGLPAAVRHPCLVQSCGRLLLLAAVESSDGEELEGYKVWRLEGRHVDGEEGGHVEEGDEGHVEGDEEGHVWSEVASMPGAMFERIAGSEHFEGLSCVAQGHLIYMTSSEGCLLHDSSLLSWSWLPLSPILANLFACIKDVYAMEPSLDMLT